jgi:hypothetical protein
MKRYDFNRDVNCRESCDMVLAPDGDWVRYDDANAALLKPDLIGQKVTSNQQGKGEIALVIKECIALLQINLEYNRGSVSEKLNAVLAQLSPIA